MTNQGRKPGLFQLEIPGVFFFTLREVHLQPWRLTHLIWTNPSGCRCTSFEQRRRPRAPTLNY
eukprot:207978-Prorocentrum_minimum.AAC.1